ncbi:DUF6376 family protein [Risungbinella massiliensis]|uniref:DUF6376 family protein n=1 Tax=Risungbinella massiliensis TaxID=1329796 RepID=UPI0005CC2139|nr:DUF6376 family protein [Risungbinella massiliensis]
MKKRSIWIISLVLMFALSGCGLISDVTNTVDYIDEASEYINMMTAFSNEGPNLFDQAVQDPAAAQELMNRLTQLKQGMEEFNSLTPPESIQEIHQQIEDANVQMIGAIDSYEKGFQDGTFNPQQLLQNNELIQTIQGINNTLQELENFQQ